MPVNPEDFEKRALADRINKLEAGDALDKLLNEFYPDRFGVDYSRDWDSVSRLADRHNIPLEWRWIGGCLHVATAIDNDTELGLTSTAREHDMQAVALLAARVLLKRIAMRGTVEERARLSALLIT
jgi:hypothetical protein